MAEMEKSERILSTSGKAELSMEPPKCANKLKPQRACTCIDKLVDEERERHARNIQFQKALVKRIEASERRIAYDDDNDDDDDDEPRGRRGGRRNRQPTPVAAPPPPVPPSIPPVKPPNIKPPFDTDKCVCYKKIIKEERKRKKFVRSLDREQRKFEKNNLRAQRKYEKARKKAFRKCDYLQEAINKKYGMGDKSIKINQGDETYSVFLHMDPGDCGCSFRERCFTKFKKRIYKFCVWFYIIGAAIGFGIFYFVGYFGDLPNNPDDRKLLSARFYDFFG